jgi:hypothetical protein
MNTNKAGIWIDHHKAVIVTIGPAEEHTTVIASKVEKHLERSGDSPLKGPYESRQVPRDDRRQMALTGELNHYYDTVIASVRDAASLLIFGPGEAKGELKTRLEKAKLDGRVAAIETADKMTDPQIAAKVRKFFARGS